MVNDRLTINAEVGSAASQISIWSSCKVSGSRNFKGLKSTCNVCVVYAPVTTTEAHENLWTSLNGFTLAEQNIQILQVILDNITPLNSLGLVAGH